MTLSERINSETVGTLNIWILLAFRSIASELVFRKDTTPQGNWNPALLYETTRFSTGISAARRGVHHLAAEYIRKPSPSVFLFTGGGEGGHATKTSQARGGGNFVNLQTHKFT